MRLLPSTYPPPVSAPHPTRRLTKWTLAAGCVLIAAAWVASAGRDWRLAGSSLKRVTLELSRGRLDLTWLSSDTLAFYRGLLKHESVPLPYRTSPLWLWSTDFDSSRLVPTFAPDYFVALPLYIPFLLLFLPTGCLWLRRGVLPGHCAKCGYDRAGLKPTEPCPECGA